MKQSEMVLPLPSELLYINSSLSTLRVMGEECSVSFTNHFDVHSIKTGKGTKKLGTLVRGLSN
jgi:hypothetical protein